MMLSCLTYTAQHYTRCPHVPLVARVSKFRNHRFWKTDSGILKPSFLTALINDVVAEIQEYQYTKIMCVDASFHSHEEPQQRHKRATCSAAESKLSTPQPRRSANLNLGRRSFQQAPVTSQRVTLTLRGLISESVYHIQELHQLGRMLGKRKNNLKIAARPSGGTPRKSRRVELLARKGLSEWA